MKVCGVIAEYDPFHRGHARHLQLAREKTGADFIVCVMSGFYTQRGMPALLPPDVRAEMALRCGADAVLQLPAAFSVREGDVFAGAGVEILESLGCVDFLCFGCETDEIGLLEKAAELLENQTPAFEEELQAGLAGGLSYAAAQGRAMEKALGADAEKLQLPNAALALGYMRALRRLGSKMQPVAVLRNNDYHADEMEQYPSATAVRSALLRGDWTTVEKAVPREALPVLRRAVMEGRICRPENMDGILRHRLLLLGESGIRKLPGVDEGLEMRIMQAARKGINRQEMLSFVKTRRYTLGRISRAMCWAVLGREKAQLPDRPDCVRILGLRESAGGLLKVMQAGRMPLVQKAARDERMQDEMHFADLWQAICGRDAAEHYRMGPVIVRE